MSDTENNTEYWGHKSTKTNFKKHFCFHSFLKNKHLELNKNCTVKRNSDIIIFKNAPVINGTCNGDLNDCRCNIYVHNFSQTKLKQEL